METEGLGNDQLAEVLRLARALEADGDFAGAAAACADFIELWRKADALSQPRVEDGRLESVRLTGLKN